MCLMEKLTFHITKVPEKQQRPNWLEGHIEIVAAEVRAECAAGRGKSAVERLAKELGIKRQTLSNRMKSFEYEPATGQRLATPWTGAG